MFKKITILIAFVTPCLLLSNSYADNLSIDKDANKIESPVVQWDTSDQDFDGSSQFYAIDDDLETVQNFSQGSIYSHFKATGTTGTLFSVSNSTVDSSEFALLINSDGSLRLHARENGVFVNDSKTTKTYNDNQEHKAVLTVSNEGTKIYVDGSLEFSGPATSFINAVTNLDSMNIGRNYDSNAGQWYFSGKIYNTHIYDTVLTDQEATDLTNLSTIIAKFDANANRDPILAGWINDSTDSGTGHSILDQNQKAWQANGTAGRAEWEMEPSLQVNQDASTLGWKMTATSRVVSGSAISDYYANGSQRFLALLSINADGDLIANLEGGSTHTLVFETGADQYHTYEISYDANTALASFKFDGTVVETWAGSETSQNIIVWGNSDSDENGIANYRRVQVTTQQG